ncbi:MAG: hypothetical protein Q4E99_05380 [Bacillota bacterium]|nr:hypothetical protein [Bacillota bacterium]
MALTDNFITNQVKQLLPIEEGYDNQQLLILIKGAKAKMKAEGVDNIFDDQDDFAYLYVICIAYQISKDMDFNIDLNKLNEYYITSVNTIRTYVNK